MKKTLIGWSSGKDSAWSLHVLRKDPDIDVVGLLTTVNSEFDRVAMHSTRSELLRLQAYAVGLPLHVVALPYPCTNEAYEKLMAEFIEKAVADGIECMAFGDLFLEDIREYRYKQLEGTGIEPIFPLWKIPTAELAETMLNAGVEAYITSVDLKKLPAAICGRQWSKELLSELSPDIDPCCENGEMHTVVVDGPMFSNRIPVSVGETVEREGFAYTDLIPEGQ